MHGMNFNLMENLNSKPVALNLMKQDIKICPRGCREHRAEGSDRRQILLVHFQQTRADSHPLLPLTVPLSVCVSV